MQDGIALPYTRARTQAWATDGTRALHMSADRMYSSQAPFLIIETNASSVGFSWDSRPAYDGQWRQAAWALIARGVRMIGTRKLFWLPRPIRVMIMHVRHE